MSSSSRSVTSAARRSFGILLLCLLALPLLSARAQVQVRMRGISADLSSSADRFISLDLNGDGYTDLLYYRPGGGYALAYLSHGDGTFRGVTYTNNGSPYNGFPGDLSNSNDTFVALDLNGDGKSDFLEFRPGLGFTFECLSVGDGSVNCRNLSTPSSLNYGFNDRMTQGNEHIVALDINGDGRQDFIVYAPGGGFAHAYLSNGDGTLTELPLTDNFTGIASTGFADDLRAKDAVLVPLDANHDGHTDLLVSAPSSGTLHFYLNNGNNTFARYDLGVGTANNYGFTGNAADPNAHLIALDLNGDGRSDFLWWQAGSGIVTGYISNGNGTFKPVPYQSKDGLSPGFITPSNSTADTAVAVNLDGTAYTGFLWYTPGQSNVVAYHSSATGALSTQKLMFNGATANNFQDVDLNAGSTALAANFLGNSGPGSFFWYSPGTGLLQAYLGTGSASSALSYYSFTATPRTYLSDLNWSIGNVPLKEVVMLGTHDSAMYGLNGGSGDESETQWGDVSAQLDDGARVLDFRSGYYLLDSAFHSCCVDLNGSVQNLDTANPGRNGFYMFGHSNVLTDYSPFTVINQVEDWLMEHPNEVVFLDMSDTSPGSTGGFQGNSGNYGSVFVQGLAGSNYPKLLYNTTAACGNASSCTSSAVFPQNTTINRLKALGTRLVLLYAPNSIGGAGWQNDITTAGYCSQYGSGGVSAAHSEIDCINNGDSKTNSLSSVRPNYAAADAATQFFAFKPDLTPFGEVEPNGDVISPLPPLTLADNSSYGFNTGSGSYDLPAQLSNGAWVPNALNFVYLDGIENDPVEGQFISRNNQTWLNANFFNSSFPQPASAISVSPTGTVWAAGAGHSISIFQYSPASSTWVQKINGEPNVKKLAGDIYGGVWVIEASTTAAGSLVYYNNSGSKSSTTSVVLDVAAGLDGSVWALGLDGSLFNLYAGTTVKPSSIPAQHGVHLAIDNRGYPWVVQSNGAIQRYNGSGWAQVTGAAANEIAIGADGSVLITGQNQPSVGRLNGQGNAFDFFHMDATHIAVDRTGHPWAIRQGTGLVYAGALDQM